MEGRRAGAGAPRSLVFTNKDKEERGGNTGRPEIRQAGHRVASTWPGGTEVWQGAWEMEPQS